MASDAGYKVKECYTLTQRDFKYTLIRFVKRVHRKAIFELQKLFGVIPQELPGFDSITGIEGSHRDLSEHPGFQLIVEHMNSESTLLEIWMKDGDISSNPKGLLWNFRSMPDFNRMRKSKLVDVAKKATENYSSLLTKYKSLEERCDILALEKVECEQELSQLKEKYSALKARNRVLQAFSDSESRKALYGI